ncbi:MAG: APC family permease [Eubacteriaceae bacterium]|nr:APC family permease [Eubacteriaceae bacterium]
MSENRTGLARAMGRTDIIALGFGTMVGWVWIILITTWLTQAGFWGTIIAFAAGIGVILLIGMAYGELTSALPLFGGEMVYAYRAVGLKFSWAVGWTMVLAYLGVAVWEGIALASALDYLLPIPDSIFLWEVAGEPVYLSWALVGAAGGLVMMFLNLFGTKPAIIFQVMATIVIIGMGIMMLLGGISFGSVENIGSGFKDVSGVFYVMLLMPSMLIGFEVIPQSAEEMNIGGRDIGKMMIVCIVISSIWYLMIIISVGLGAPEEVRGSGELPALDVCAYIFGNEKFATILIWVGLLGILTSWNGFFRGASRLIFAMGRARMIPKVFATTGRRFNTPWVAVLVVGIICMLAMLMGKSVLNWMVNTSSACALFSYCCVAFSCVILRIKEPELQRPFRAGKSIAAPLIIFIMTIIYFVIYIVNASSQEEYHPAIAVIAVWFIFGIILNLGCHRSNGKISREEREHLIFGDKLARRLQDREAQK